MIIVYFIFSLLTAALTGINANLRQIELTPSTTCTALLGALVWPIYWSFIIWYNINLPNRK